MIQRCPNCDGNLDGQTTCPSCGWQMEPYRPKPKWMMLAATYVGLLAVFGACGTAIYVGLGSVFGFGPFGNVLFVKLLAGVLAVLFVIKLIVNRSLRR